MPVYKLPDGKMIVLDSSPLNVLREQGLSIEQDGSDVTIKCDANNSGGAQAYLHSQKTGALGDKAMEAGLPTSSTSGDTMTLKGSGDIWKKMNNLASAIMGHALENGGPFGAQLTKHIKAKGREPGAAHENFGRAAEGVPKPQQMIPGQGPTQPTVGQNHFRR